MNQVLGEPGAGSNFEEAGQSKRQKVDTSQWLSACDLHPWWWICLPSEVSWWRIIILCILYILHLILWMLPCRAKKAHLIQSMYEWIADCHQLYWSRKTLIVFQCLIRSVCSPKLMLLWIVSSESANHFICCKYSHFLCELTYSAIKDLISSLYQFFLFLK